MTLVVIIITAYLHIIYFGTRKKSFLLHFLCIHAVINFKFTFHIFNYHKKLKTMLGTDMHIGVETPQIL